MVVTDDGKGSCAGIKIELDKSAGIIPGIAEPGIVTGIVQAVGVLIIEHASAVVGARSDDETVVFGLKDAVHCVLAEDVAVKVINGNGLSSAVYAELVLFKEQHSCECRTFKIHIGESEERFDFRCFKVDPAEAVSIRITGSIVEIQCCIQVISTLIERYLLYICRISSFRNDFADIEYRGALKGFGIKNENFIQAVGIEDAVPVNAGGLDIQIISFFGEDGGHFIRIGQPGYGAGQIAPEAEPVEIIVAGFIVLAALTDDGAAVIKCLNVGLDNSAGLKVYFIECLVACIVGYGYINDFCSGGVCKVFSLSAFVGEYAGLIKKLSALFVCVYGIIGDIVAIDDVEAIFGYDDVGSNGILGEGDAPASALICFGGISLVVKPSLENDVNRFVFSNIRTIVVNDEAAVGVAAIDASGEVFLAEGIFVRGVEAVKNVAFCILNVDSDELCVPQKVEFHIGERIKYAVTIGGECAPIGIEGVALHVCISVQTKALIGHVSSIGCRGGGELLIVELTRWDLPIITTVKHGGVIPIADKAEEGEGKIVALAVVIDQLNEAFEIHAGSAVLMEVIHKLFGSGHGNGNCCGSVCGNGYSLGAVEVDERGNFIGGAVDELYGYGALIGKVEAAGMLSVVNIFGHCEGNDGIAAFGIADVVYNKSECKGSVLIVTELQLGARTTGNGEIGHSLKCAGDIDDTCALLTHKALNLMRCAHQEGICEIVEFLCGCVGEDLAQTLLNECDGSGDMGSSH